MTPFDPTDDPIRPECEAGLAALHRRLDGDPNWDSPEALGHRIACAACREELALAGHLGAVAEPVVVPVGLGDRVAGVVQADRTWRQRRRWVGGALALAVSIAVIAVAVRPPVRPDPIESKPIEVVKGPAEEPVRPLGDSVAEARQALRALSRKTAEVTRIEPTELLPAPMVPKFPETGGKLEPLAGARVSAAKSVEPIAASARRAVQFFVRADANHNER